MNLFFKKLVVPNEIIYQILLVLEEEKKVLTNLRLANKSFFYTISTHFLFNKFKPKCIQSLQNFTKTLAEFKHLSTLVKEVSFSELTPRWTEVTNSHVIELAKVLPELISLDLEMCERINDSAVQYIIENCKMLEELTLNDCIGIN
ncbi:hypothetical protein HK099_004206 [Clydaea vesicula]|uniref:F-box domain-containing protein n=1 Tax=Clydaea vesicula TaxID=447962 RepID=A0AAD5U109_9FUNG|nr:hypothetical protein HK099_004206 [Clydaea vesicula]